MSTPAASAQRVRTGHTARSVLQRASFRTRQARGDQAVGNRRIAIRAVKSARQHTTAAASEEGECWPIGRARHHTGCATAYLIRISRVTGGC